VNGSYKVKFEAHEIDFEPEFRWVTMIGSIKERTGVDFTDFDYAQAKAEAKKLGVEGDELISIGQGDRRGVGSESRTAHDSADFRGDFPGGEFHPWPSEHREDARSPSCSKFFVAAQEMGQCVFGVETTRWISCSDSATGQGPGRPRRGKRSPWMTIFVTCTGLRHGRPRPGWGSESTG